MGKNISTVLCDLIGISCMKDCASAQIKKEWDKRFHEHHTFWVDLAKKKDSGGLIQKITEVVAAQGITTLTGRTVVLSVFLDLTQCPDMQLLEQIAEVPYQLNNTLGCNVPVMLTFGNLGKIAFADKELLRKHAAQVVDVHNHSTRTRKQLILVASAPLVQSENDKSWKAVATLIDILRREADPASVLPIAGSDNPNDDVGFLRYGEYDEMEITQVHDRIKNLSEALGEGGASELHAILQREISKIEEQIKSTWEIDASMQPLHPDLVVEGWLAQNKARRGRNAKYEAARHATIMAVEATGRQMKEAVLNAYVPTAEAADGYLRSYMKEANVGVSLEEDQVRMHSALKMMINPCSMPQFPALVYSGSSHTEEISYYLHCVRDCAICEVKERFVQAILAAYDHQSEAYYSEKRKNLQVQLEKERRRLTGYMDKQTLTQISASGQALPETSFFPMRGGGTQCRMVLCREAEDDTMLSHACAGTPTTVYFIDKKYGNVRELDHAPIKSLQLLMFDCATHLDDLIK